MVFALLGILVSLTDVSRFCHLGETTIVAMTIIYSNSLAPELTSGNGEERQLFRDFPQDQLLGYAGWYPIHMHLQPRYLGIISPNLRLLHRNFCPGYAMTVMFFLEGRALSKAA